VVLDFSLTVRCRRFAAQSGDHGDSTKQLLEETMPIEYTLLRLEALAQPVAIDHVLRLIKKRVLLVMVQLISLVTLGRS